jgi:hypothetical protein
MLDVFLCCVYLHAVYVQVYDDAVAHVTGSSSNTSSSGATVMQQLDCAGYFARGLVLLARQKVHTVIYAYHVDICAHAVAVHTDATCGYAQFC